MALPAGYTLDDSTPAANLPKGYTLDAQPAAPKNLYPTFSKIPGFDYVRPAFDLAAGAGSGLTQTAAGVYDLLRKIPGADKVLPDSQAFHAAIKDATPDTTPAHIGKFLEGAAEFGIPAGKAAELTRGMGLLPRALAQGAVGGGVSAAQTGGDPAATAVGAALGSAGEVVPAAVSGVRNLIANRAPNLVNFAKAFGGATPAQKQAISEGLDVLQKDGIVPPDNIHDMKDIVDAKFRDVSAAYNQLPTEVRAREMPVDGIIARLRNLQGNYTSRAGKVISKGPYDAIQEQINTLQDVRQVNLDELVKFKSEANGQTNWDSNDRELQLWKKIGDIYRGAENTLTPETTPLNQRYQVYSELQKALEQNIKRGKGLPPTIQDQIKHGFGASAGSAIGAAVGGPAGAFVGGQVGATIGPKLTAGVAQAIQNAIDSGQFSRMAPIRQGLLRSMAAMGDNAGILRLLGTSGIEESATGR